MTTSSHSPDIEEASTQIFFGRACPLLVCLSADFAEGSEAEGGCKGSKGGKSQKEQHHSGCHEQRNSAQDDEEQKAAEAVAKGRHFAAVTGLIVLLLAL